MLHKLTRQLYLKCTNRPFVLAVSAKKQKFVLKRISLSIHKGKNKGV